MTSLSTCVIGYSNYLNIITNICIQLYLRFKYSFRYIVITDASFAEIASFFQFHEVFNSLHTRVLIAIHIYQGFTV